jgi:two-component system nitrogen regulation response regulator GlnG/two-component system response regulator HydG
VSSGETTLIEEGQRRGSAEIPPEVLALAVAWCPDDPELLGEVIVLPSGPGPFLLGRGLARPDDPHPRVFPARLRPGRRTAPGDAISSPRVSRQQLLLRPVGVDAIEVENVGRGALLHDGGEVKGVQLRPGETLQIGGALLLLCVRRPAWLPGDPDPADDRIPFGGADEGGIVGESPATWRLRRRVAFVASRPDHVLILGASGTGKELVARDIHARSARAHKPMVSRNAATFPEGLIDAELFGNARNFPNPGMVERPGLVGQAAGSTLFLDEFAELPVGMQAHLLRVLDAGEYQRLGESETRRSSFRLVAATNRSESSLKHDVAARLTFRVEVPALDERREDIPLLVVHLMRQLGRENPDVAESFFAGGDPNGRPELPCSFVRSLVVRPYTTNVRELRNALWRALADHIEGTRPITENAPEPSGPRPSSMPPPQGEGLASEQTLTPAAIQACLDRHNGVLEQAWRELGLTSRYALARLVAKHGLEIRKRKKR